MGSDDIKKKEILANKAKRLKKKNQKNKSDDVSRRGDQLPEIPKILILTEGTSEIYYFESLIKMLRLSNLVDVEESDYTDDRGIIGEATTLGDKAKKNKLEYPYIFCIFDLDNVKNKSFYQDIENYNSEDCQIIPILSYPCFETWLLLHYQIHDAPFIKSGNKSVGDTAKDYLKSIYPEYNETNEECIKNIATNYRIAITHSEKLANRQMEVNSINPITNVHTLVKLLIHIADRDNNYEYEDKNLINPFIRDNLTSR